MKKYKRFIDFKKVVKRGMTILLKTSCMDDLYQNKTINHLTVKVKCMHNYNFCVSHDELRGSGCDETWMVDITNFVWGKIITNINCDKIVVL